MPQSVEEHNDNATMDECRETQEPFGSSEWVNQEIESDDFNVCSSNEGPVDTELEDTDSATVSTVVPVHPELHVDFDEELSEDIDEMDETDLIYQEENECSENEGEAAGKINDIDLQLEGMEIEICEYQLEIEQLKDMITKHETDNDLLKERIHLLSQENALLKSLVSQSQIQQCGIFWL